MQLLVNNNNLKHEEVEEIDVSVIFPLVLFPTSPFKLVWNVIIIILLLYTATYVPYATAFINDNGTIEY